MMCVEPVRREVAHAPASAWLDAIHDFRAWIRTINDIASRPVAAITIPKLNWMTK